jgi:hypothetical protein
MTSVEKDCRIHWLLADRIFWAEAEFARRLNEATDDVLKGPGNGRSLLSMVLESKSTYGTRP